MGLRITLNADQTPKCDISLTGQTIVYFLAHFSYVTEQNCFQVVFFYEIRPITNETFNGVPYTTSKFSLLHFHNFKTNNNDSFLIRLMILLYLEKNYIFATDRKNKDFI